MTALRTVSLALVATVLTFASASASTITVDTANDVGTADGFCSLREAILAANNDVAENDCPAGNGADLILFDLPLSTTILLLADLPMISETVMIRGPGPNELTLDGGYSHRLLVFNTPYGEWLGVEGLTLTNGLAPGTNVGGGAFVNPGDTALFRRVNFINNISSNGGGGLAVSGGGPSSSSSVTVVDCYFAGNVAQGAAGGGGLATIGGDADIRVVRSTFYDNFASYDAGNGGAIRVVNGNLIVESSTFSGNRATGSGGAIDVFMNHPYSTSIEAVIMDSTITDNQAAVGGVTAGSGGGAKVYATSGHQVQLFLMNTVIAGNYDYGGSSIIPDLLVGSGVSLEASGSSFIGVNSGCESDFPAGSPNGAGNFVGTDTTPLDPLLQALAYHGAGTPVHHPETAPMSPLVDMGACPGAVVDQRRYGSPASNERPVDVPEAPNVAGGDNCDIGSVEVWAEPNTDPVIFADGFESSTTLFWTE